jgi:alginate O-acetyltransferase complex protein AlgI
VAETPEMLFTEPLFLFVFLPLTLAIYFAAPAFARNTLITVASLLFYGFGEPKFVPIMLFSIGLNYVLAIWIERHRGGRRANLVLAIGIASDLALLLLFKYARWFLANLDPVFASLGWPQWELRSIWLPLGISFFTFHKISYKIDVYRGVTKAQRNPLTLALYILFFPQLIAGPIVRYHDISDQLATRSVRATEFAEGIRRFIVGLAKKMLIANTVALVADTVFSLPANELGMLTAWLGVLCYTLQIYFDFSGYSDMAIGLAMMFGFRFLENFEHPYSSRSITEFWRRWHISLSRWFRDYLYIPLGGNRAGTARTYLNLMIVFTLCGLWHGASWVFLIWGLFHGLFLVIERGGLSRWLETAPPLFARLYLIIIVMIGWVFFRSESVGHASTILAAMFGSSGATADNYPPGVFLDSWTLLIVILGLVFSFPARRWIATWFQVPGRAGTELSALGETGAMLALVALLLLSLMVIAAGTYNPFLYFRF